MPATMTDRQTVTAASNEVTYELSGNVDLLRLGDIAKELPKGKSKTIVIKTDTQEEFLITVSNASQANGCRISGVHVIRADGSPAHQDLTTLGTLTVRSMLVIGAIWSYEFGGRKVLTGRVVSRSIK